MVTVRLRTADRAAGDRDDTELCTELIDRARAAHHVAHAYGGATPGGVAVVLFVAARSLPEAETRARGACEQLLVGRAGVELLSCAVEIFLPATWAGLSPPDPW